MLTQQHDNRQSAAKAFWERMAQLIGNEEPFAWAARHGINKSTFQSAKERGNKPLSKTIEKWALAIGCNHAWLSDGKGEPFGAIEPDTAQKPALDNPVAKSEIHESIALDLQILELSVETLESVLHLTRRQMSHTQKAKLIVAIYQLYASTPDHHDKMRPVVESLIRSAA